MDQQLSGCSQHTLQRSTSSWRLLLSSEAIQCRSFGIGQTFDHVTSCWSSICSIHVIMNEHCLVLTDFSILGKTKNKCVCIQSNRDPIWNKSLHILAQCATISFSNRENEHLEVMSNTSAMNPYSSDKDLGTFFFFIKQIEMYSTFLFLLQKDHTLFHGWDLLDKKNCTLSKRSLEYKIHTRHLPINNEDRPDQQDNAKVTMCYYKGIDDRHPTVDDGRCLTKGTEWDRDTQHHFSDAIHSWDFSIEYSEDELQIEADIDWLRDWYVDCREMPDWSSTLSKNYSLTAVTVCDGSKDKR